MEYTMIEFLENGLHEEIFLYNELLNCFKREKESLINMDLDTLWKISKEKNELCSMINSAEQKIFSMIRPKLDKQHFEQFEKAAGFNRWSQLLVLITDIVAEKDKPKFNRLYYSLQKLKSEIDAMRKVNTDTVEHSLQFLDEIISIITGQARQEAIYNDRCRYNHSGNKMLMSREV
ncbi:MAG: flagellar protein FlgN [Proteobacteria bacterium]|nr:flagellar protein FlgN [Pseudomonadota bacterium]MBU4009235.1 flagellar protein FlgN [Pseudomonadota bacterium]MBU4035770.1 flagellar protein FlgN [Pseudomonadota bacterium]